MIIKFERVDVEKILTCYLLKTLNLVEVDVESTSTYGSDFEFSVTDKVNFLETPVKEGDK